MKTQLKIIAWIMLVLSIFLLIFTVKGLWDFWSYWSMQQSVLSDSSSFFSLYDEYFTYLDVSPMWSLFVSTAYGIISYGLLKTKWWAGYIAFFFLTFSLLGDIYAIANADADLHIYADTVLSAYMLYVLFGNKNDFSPPKWKTREA